MDVIPIYLDEAGQRENIKRTTHLIADITGEAPTGWISPRGTGSTIHSALLTEAGYLRQGDCNDDDLPYLEQYGDRQIIGLPLTMDVNDLPSAIRYGNNARSLLQQFEDTLVACLERDTFPLFFDVTIHTHVYGRPAGAWVFGEIMEKAKSASGVWIGTRHMAAQHAKAFPSQRLASG
ncbi:hypothetical protein [Bradyrhizobium manausense]|uniref:hypothetical protein n=1 Tax=Bradyrhizobium manausense TaxID=989370 RepID=UPI001BA55C34|nr:hypothetical protein [Bradyrhizobium manausense]MBR0725577.1 hypothetical protein [Bradyrhizobium manausense]